MTTLTKVGRFIDANRVSPVVEGRVLDLQIGGAFYRLENGMQFKLTRDECREIARLTGSLPRWKGVAA